VVQIGAVSAAKCMAAPRCWRGPTKTTARVYDGMISPTRAFLSLIVAVAVIIILGLVAVGGLLKKIAETTF
jgi:hypothetical protein